MKERINLLIPKIVETVKTNKNVRNLWIYGLLLVIGSLVVKMFLLAFMIILVTLFFTMGNLKTLKSEQEEMEQELIEEKEYLETIYEKLKKHSEENNLTLEEKRELIELEMEIDEIKKELENLKTEKI